MFDWVRGRRSESAQARSFIRGSSHGVSDSSGFNGEDLDHSWMSPSIEAYEECGRENSLVTRQGDKAMKEPRIISARRASRAKKNK
jgi:hypothetical protein